MFDHLSGNGFAAACRAHPLAPHASHLLSQQWVIQELGKTAAQLLFRLTGADGATKKSALPLGKPTGELWTTTWQGQGWDSQPHHLLCSCAGGGDTCFRPSHSLLESPWSNQEKHWPKHPAFGGFKGAAWRRAAAESQASQQFTQLVLMGAGAKGCQNGQRHGAWHL